LCSATKKIKKKTISQMRNIVVWNNLAPSPKLAAEAHKKAPTGQHVLHTMKRTYILSKCGEWRCVRGARNIADLIRAAHKKATAKPVAVTATIIGAATKAPAPTTKKVIVAKTVVAKKKPVRTKKPIVKSASAAAAAAAANKTATVKKKGTITTKLKKN
jgi:hypothetical protein